MKLSRSGKRLLVVPLVLALAALGGATSALLAVCGPFTDVSGPFCPFILQMYYLGITAGTSPTTYSPDDPVTRGQAAVFIARSFDQSVKRSSRRAPLNQWWTPRARIDRTTVVPSAIGVRSDGADLWVANGAGVVRVHASDGRRPEVWTAEGSNRVLVAMGRVFVTGAASPGRLYMIDPSQPPGPATTVASNLGVSPRGIAFDGSRIWTANLGPPGSVSIVTPGASLPWSVTTVTTDFSGLQGILYDGTNIWVTDTHAHTLLRLDPNGAILQTVSLVGSSPQFPIFDGTNIWVPLPASVRVVRASTGAVVALLPGNGLNDATEAAFDGERILVTSSHGVALWKAADLTPIGFVPTARINARGACSDGLNFWVTSSFQGELIRF